MSTILKALKKIEPDAATRFDRDGSRGKPPLFDHQPTPHYHSPQKRRKGYWLIIPLLVILIGLFIWRILPPNKRPTEKQAVNTFPVPKQPLTENTSIPAETQKEATLPKEELVSSSPAVAANHKKQSRGEHKPDKFVSPISAKKPPAAIDKPPTASPAPRDTIEKDEKIALSPEKKPRPSTKTDSTPQEKSNAPQNRNRAKQWQDAKRLNDDQMMLQALVWANEPEKRMGMIDGQMIHEGDDANGYTVVEIRPEDIILKQGGQYFRLEFQRR